MVCQKLRAEEKNVIQLKFDSPLSAGFYSIEKQVIKLMSYCFDTLTTVPLK